jgi:hypothetical protein
MSSIRSASSELIFVLWQVIIDLDFVNQVNDLVLLLVYQFLDVTALLEVFWFTPPNITAVNLEIHCIP